MRFVQNCFYATIFLLCAISASGKSNGIESGLFCATSCIYESSAIRNNPNVLAFKKCRRISTHLTTKYLLLEYKLSNPSVYCTEVSHNFTKWKTVIKSRLLKKHNRKGLLSEKNNRVRIFSKFVKSFSETNPNPHFNQKISFYLQLGYKIMQPLDCVAYLSVQRT